jgi:hypothetical protein
LTPSGFAGELRIVEVGDDRADVAEQGRERRAHQHTCERVVARDQAAQLRAQQLADLHAREDIGLGRVRVILMDLLLPLPGLILPLHDDDRLAVPLTLLVTVVRIIYNSSHRK